MRRTCLPLTALALLGAVAAAAEPATLPHLPPAAMLAAPVGDTGPNTEPDPSMPGESVRPGEGPEAAAAVAPELLATLRRDREDVARQVAVLVASLAGAGAEQVAAVHAQISELKRAGERRALAIQLEAARGEGRTDLVQQLTAMLDAFDAPAPLATTPEAATGRNGGGAR